MQASYFGKKCIDECETVSYFPNCQTNNCNQVKAKCRTCPVGGMAPVSPTNKLSNCDDVDNGLDNTCEVIRQETVLFSTPETDYIIYD